MTRRAQTDLLEDPLSIEFVHRAASFLERRRAIRRMKIEYGDLRVRRSAKLEAQG